MSSLSSVQDYVTLCFYIPPNTALARTGSLCSSIHVNYEFGSTDFSQAIVSFILGSSNILFKFPYQKFIGD